MFLTDNEWKSKIQCLWGLGVIRPTRIPNKVFQFNWTCFSPDDVSLFSSDSLVPTEDGKITAGQCSLSQRFQVRWTLLAEDLSTLLAVKPCMWAWVIVSYSVDETNAALSCWWRIKLACCYSNELWAVLYRAAINFKSRWWFTNTSTDGDYAFHRKWLLLLWATLGHKLLQQGDCSWGAPALIV